MQSKNLHKQNRALNTFSHTHHQPPPFPQTEHTMSELEDGDVPLRILLIGDLGVGKSSLLLRFANDTFTDHYVSTTIGVAYKLCETCVEGRNVKLQVWDVAGQERFRTATAAQFKEAQGILILFDIADVESFHNLGEWIKEVQRYGRPDARILLVANKHDLHAERAVDPEAIADFSRRRHLPVLETSAKTGHNVKRAFEQIAAGILALDSDPTNALTGCLASPSSSGTGSGAKADKGAAQHQGRKADGRGSGLPHASGKHIHAGWLEKRRPDLLPLWQKRHFLLTDKELVYSRTDSEDCKLSGRIMLSNITRISRPKSSSGRHFNVHIPGRVYVLRSSSMHECRRWIVALHSATRLVPLEDIGFLEMVTGKEVPLAVQESTSKLLSVASSSPSSASSSSALSSSLSPSPSSSSSSSLTIGPSSSPLATSDHILSRTTPPSAPASAPSPAGTDSQHQHPSLCVEPHHVHVLLASVPSTEQSGVASSRPAAATCPRGAMSFSLPSVERFRQLNVSSRNSSNGARPSSLAVAPSTSAAPSSSSLSSTPSPSTSASTSTSSSAAMQGSLGSVALAGRQVVAFKCLQTSSLITHVDYFTRELDLLRSQRISHSSIANLVGCGVMGLQTLIDLEHNLSKSSSSSSSSRKGDNESSRETGREKSGSENEDGAGMTGEGASSLLGTSTGSSHNNNDNNNNNSSSNNSNAGSTMTGAAKKKKSAMKGGTANPLLELARTVPHVPFYLMEYMELSLADVLLEPQFPLTSSEAMFIMFRVADAIAYLHGCHPPVVHANLNPTHVLINTGFDVKVGGFGCARAMRSPSETFKDPVGSPGYTAPEIFLDQRWSREVDVFALGLVLFEIMHRRRAHGDAAAAPAVYRRAVLSHTPPAVEVPTTDLAVLDAGHGGKLQATIAQCVDDVAQRPTASDVFAAVSEVRQAHGLMQRPKPPFWLQRAAASTAPPAQ